MHFTAPSMKLPTTANTEFYPWFELSNRNGEMHLEDDYLG
jgi:hypothetical protein